ncbi:hypothetical protein AAMO2058_000653900 [Amorphochlora amoebiformis]
MKANERDRKTGRKLKKKVIVKVEFENPQGDYDRTYGAYGTYGTDGTDGADRTHGSYKSNTYALNHGGNAVTQSQSHAKTNTKQNRHFSRKASEMLLTFALEVRLPVLKKALRQGADVNVKGGPWGGTPLIYVCGSSVSKKRNEAAVFLCESKADVNSRDKDGFTALIHASCMKDINLIHTLLNAKADVNKTCRKGNSPLMYGCSLGELYVVRELLKGGADVNKMNKNRDDAFTIAAANAHLDILRSLDELGLPSLQTYIRLDRYIVNYESDEWVRVHVQRLRVRRIAGVLNRDLPNLSRLHKDVIYAAHPVRSKSKGAKGRKKKKAKCLLM